MFRKLLTALSVSAVLALLFAASAFALTQDQIDAQTGPAFGISNTLVADEPADAGKTASSGSAQAAAAASGQEKATPSNASGQNVTADEAGVEHGTRGALIGEFKTTGYCNCYLCCHEHAGGPTASGVMPRAKHTVAADTRVLPFGTKIIIGDDSDIVYTVEDIGGSVWGNVVDVYYAEHWQADGHGLQYKNVYYAQ